MKAAEPAALLSVTSQFANIELVLAVVQDLLRGEGVDENSQHWVALAIREAMANAIRHGNREDPSKKVEVELALENGELSVVVRDEGRGFEPQEVEDPLADENILKPRGRGIFYMRRLMDDVDYRFSGTGGTEVVLRKDLNEPSPDRAPDKEGES